MQQRCAIRRAALHSVVAVDLAVEIDHRRGGQLPGGAGTLGPHRRAVPNPSIGASAVAAS